MKFQIITEVTMLSAYITLRQDDDDESFKFDFKNILCIDDAAIIYDFKGILQRKPLKSLFAESIYLVSREVKRTFY